ncbi:MAG: SMC family ATPase [Planctomycetes bacterium]|nr:SMC family ATPase [Planctomycetota bacterium]
MRILSVRVKNFRMHEDRTVTFDRERTVVAGPNEAGKSTLVDAIERVLCYPHRSTAGDLDGIKPKAGGGAPEVILQFEQDGGTYVIHKIFKGNAQSVATLTDDAGNQFRGDEAEERLRALLGFGNAALRNPFFGWSHLWARQGEAGNDPTDADALGPAAKDLDSRLKSLTGTTLTESRTDTATYDRIAAEYAATFKQGEAARGGSQLAIAETDLETARGAATQAAAQLAAYEAAADTIVHEESLIRESRNAIVETEHRLTELRQTLEQIDAIEQTLATQHTALSKAVETHTELEQADAQITQLASEIATRTSAIAPREQEIERLRVHEARLQTDVGQSLDAIKQTNESQRSVTTEENLLKSIEMVFELEAIRVELTAVLEQIEAYQAVMATIDARLRKLPELDKAAVETLEGLDRQLAVAQGKLEASATRVEVLTADTAVTVDGQSLTAGGAKTLTNPAEIAIGAGTRIRVTPGGDASLIDLRARITELDEDLKTKLADLGLKSVAEARTTLEERLAEQARRDQLQQAIDELDGDDVQKQLNDTDAEIQKINAEITRKQPAGFERPTDAAAVGAALNALAERRQDADAAVEEAHAKFNNATRELTQTRETRETLEAELTTERQAVRGLDVQKAALEQVHGTDRQTRLQGLADEKAEKHAAVAGTQRRLDALNPDTVRADKERLENAVAGHAEQITQAGIRKATAEGQLLNVGTSDLHGMKAAADARLDVARRRHAEVNNRAQAVRRLKELFDRQRKTFAELVAAPLRAKVAEYLDQLYGPGNRIAVTKSGDAFEDFAVSRQSAGNQHFKFDDLSGGTREQVAAACRLAMAEVLAGSSNEAGQTVAGCLPMVFDDAFVNSDPERIKAVQRVLYLGARRGLQIIVLSCNPKDYDQFAATRIDLPPPKLPEISVPNAASATSTAADHEAADGEGDAADVAESTASCGRVPSGDDASLAAAFVTALAARPDRKSGNKSLRQHLGWDEATYERIKAQLIVSGRLQPGRGRGGSVQLLDDN